MSRNNDCKFSKSAPVTPTACSTIKKSLAEVCGITTNSAPLISSYEGNEDSDLKKSTPATVHNEVRTHVEGLIDHAIYKSQTPAETTNKAIHTYIANLIDIMISKSTEHNDCENRNSDRGKLIHTCIEDLIDRAINKSQIPSQTTNEEIHIYVSNLLDSIIRKSTEEGDRKTESFDNDKNSYSQMEPLRECTKSQKTTEEINMFVTNLIDSIIHESMEKKSSDEEDTSQTCIDSSNYTIPSNHVLTTRGEIDNNVTDPGKTDITQMILPNLKQNDSNNQTSTEMEVTTSLKIQEDDCEIDNNTEKLLLQKEDDCDENKFIEEGSTESDKQTLTRRSKLSAANELKMQQENYEIDGSSENLLLQKEDSCDKEKFIEEASIESDKPTLTKRLKLCDANDELKMQHDERELDGSKGKCPEQQEACVEKSPVQSEAQTPIKRLKLCDAGEKGEINLAIEINKLKKKVIENKEILRKLKLSKTYKTKQSEELDDLIQKWRRASQEALVELTEHVEQNASVSDILQHYNIDHKLVGFNRNKGTFEDNQTLK